MSLKPRISVVIPVYNESGSLPELVQLLEQGLGSHSSELIFIDDGSTDESPQTLRDLQSKSPIPFHIFTQPRNFGKSLAMSLGMEHSQGEIIATLDADLQNDPRDLQLFLDEMEKGADLVIGWRFRRDDPLEKKLPSRFFNWVTSKASGLSIHDFNCGFKVYHRKLLEAIPLYGDMHRFIPMLAHKKGFKVVEIQVTHHPRRHGVSKFGLERYWRGALDLLTVVFLTTYLFRPMHLFGTLGLSIIAIGKLLFLYLFFGRWIWGESIGSSPLFTISFFAIGIGFQILIFGFLAEMMVHWQKTQEHQWRIQRRKDQEALSDLRTKICNVFLSKNERTPCNFP